MFKSKSTCFLTVLVLLSSSLMAAENFCDGKDARCGYCYKNGTGDQICSYCAFDWQKNSGCKTNSTIAKCMFPELDLKDNTVQNCFGCMQGYAPSDDGKSCVKMTVPSCIIGTKECNSCQFECQHCEKDKLLQNNSCVDIPSNVTKIAHCMYHSEIKGAIKCSLCEEGYSLTRKDYADSCIPECAKGCKACVNSECSECNTLKGYFMTSVKNCSYKGFPEGFEGDSDTKNSNSNSRSGSLVGKVLSICLTGFTLLSLLFW